MPRKRKRRTRDKLPAPLILAGIVLLIVAVIFLKNRNQAPAATGSLENQLDQALQKMDSTFVFLHSTDCIPCMEMMDVVAEVYPEFDDSVPPQWQSTNCCRGPTANSVVSLPAGLLH